MWLIKLFAPACLLLLCPSVLLALLLLLAEAGGEEAMGAADKWLLPLVSVSFVSLMLFLSALSGFTASSALFARLPPPRS